MMTLDNNESAMDPERRSLPKTPTGIAGLDQITGGGLPRGRPTLVCGSAGCGNFAGNHISLGGEVAFVRSFKILGEFFQKYQAAPQGFSHRPR